MKSERKLKVYYDGLCQLCSREIIHYRRQTGSDQIEFIDICGADFDALKAGLDPLEVHKVMHVRRPDGSLATRVQAFIEIWQILPKYHDLAKLAKKVPLRQILEIGYSVFLRLRPWLPRKKAQIKCEESPYCEVKNA